MSRKLRLLDLALLLCLGLLAFQIRRDWIETHAREQALMGQRSRSASVPSLAPLPAVEHLTAAEYADIAAKDLFSKDRNPNVIIDPPAPAPPKPVPPFPAAHGVMLWPGVAPTVVLSEKPGGPQKSYRPGDKVAEWKIVSIDTQHLVLEWDGKQFDKRIDELLEKTPVVAAAPAKQPAAAAANRPAQSLGSLPASTSLANNKNTPQGPGMDVGGGFKACTPGDSSPSGAVVDGMKKVVTQTPFGNSCRWEPAK